MVDTNFRRCRFLGWSWLCICVLVSTIVGAENADYCTNNDEVDRLIALDKHGRIAYVGTASEAHQNLRLRYRRDVDGSEELYELDDVPQYFSDLRDQDIENEVEFRIQHRRWSDRVVLEKLYFGLSFGLSGFPEGYYNVDADDDDEAEPLKLDREDGWDIFARNVDYCEWTGVTCRQSRVTELRLDNYEFEGTLTEDIRFLTDLEYFDLKGNFVTGTVPAALGDLTNLKYLCLAVNKFEGTLPSESIGKLRNLEKVWLSGNSFTGPLPNNLLQQLPKLTLLDLSDNGLVGGIPKSFGTDCPNITNMFLEMNRLTGCLPEDVSGLQSLLVFDVGHNQLTGTIPTSWMSLTNLKEFNLSVNHFTGTIPLELLNLSELSVVMLSSNRLTGTLPDPDLDLNGDAPAERWENLAKLNVVLLYDNQLSGMIPAAFFEACADTLVNLDVSRNSFTGRIPDSIGKLTKLKKFHAQLNQFTGTLPPSMNLLSPVIHLNLTGNLIEGTVPNIFCGSGVARKSLLFRQFGCDAILCPPGTFHPNGAATRDSGCRPCPASDKDEEHDPPLNRILGRMECPGVEFVHGDIDGDGRLSDMEVLRLLYTYTIGENWGSQFVRWADPTSDPCELNGITCVNGKVAKIDLVDAAICATKDRKQGPENECDGLPAELSLLTDLEIIRVNKRQFLHGTIPSEFGQMTKLKYLDLGSCPNIVGSIPSELGRLTNMKILNFAGCRLTGTLPEEFWGMTNLEKVHLSMNMITGTISTMVGEMLNMKELLWSRSQLSGPIPDEIGQVAALENLELYGNQLTGTIPSSIGQCLNLKRIDLFNNHLYGPLPASLTKLPSLQIFHVKLNHFTGTIPAGFGDLPFLTWFDVSSNELHGTIPESFASSRSIKDFRLGGNMIYDPIPQALCTNTNINGGLTRTYGCDGVICPLDTYSEPGHATHSEGCKPCPEGLNTLYLGSPSCETVSDADIVAIFFNVMSGASRNAIQINHWKDPVGDDVCTWNGITCDKNGYVASVRFPLAGLDDPDLA